MATPIDEKKFEFREWMDSQKLKVTAVASRFGISEQTAFNWRSKGVPVGRQEFVTRTIAEWSSGSAIGPRLHVQATDAQFRAWNMAAMEAGKLMEDWARDGLDEMAQEYFSNPQLSLQLRVGPKLLSKVAEEPTPYRTKNDSGNS